MIQFPSHRSRPDRPAPRSEAGPSGLPQPAADPAAPPPPAGRPVANFSRPGRPPAAGTDPGGEAAPKVYRAYDPRSVAYGIVGDTPHPAPAAPGPGMRAAVRNPLHLREDWPLPPAPPAGSSATAAPARSAAPLPLHQRFSARRRAEDFRATGDRLGRALASGKELENAIDQDTPMWRARKVRGNFLGRIFPLLGRRGEVEAILKAYNAEKGDLKASFYKTPEAAMRAAGKTLAPGEHLRAVTTFDGAHALAMEFRCHGDGAISLLILDSWKVTAEHDGHFARLSRRLDSPRHNPGGRIEAVLVGCLGVQKDIASCTGFSKDFIAGFEKHPEAFHPLHDHARRLARETGFAGGSIGPAHINAHEGDRRIHYFGETNAPKILPMRVYKNLQSTQLLADALNARPDAAEERVNRKRGENILGRLERVSGKPWAIQWEDGRWRKHDLSWSDKAMPMAHTYEKLHRLSADHLEARLAAARKSKPSPTGPAGGPSGAGGA